MPEIRNADFFDTNNCNILSQLMPEEMKSYMRDFINGNLFMNPVGKAMEGINSLMGDNLSILDGLGGTIEGLDSLADDLSAISLELQAFTDHTNRLSGISVDSVRANFATTFNIMAGFNAMVDTFKNADELLEDNFSKAFSSLDPNITGPFLKDISGNLGKINSVLKDIQRQCAIAGGPAGDACAKLVGSLSSIVNSLQSASGNITGILNQDNAAFAVALAALERYALGNTLISSALQDPCFSGALAKNFIMNPEGALKLDDVAKKFGKDIPGSRPLLADYIGGGDDKQVSPLEKGDPAPPTPPAPQTPITGSEGTVNITTTPPAPAVEPPSLLAAPPAEDFVSYPDSFPKSTDPEPEEDLVSLPEQEQNKEIESSESHPDETKIVNEPPQKPCGSHIRGDSRTKLLQYVNSYLAMGSGDFSGPDDAVLLKVAARDIFYSNIVESANFIFRTSPSYRKDPTKVTNYQDKVLKVAEAVIIRGVKVQKKKTSGENWEMTDEFLEGLVGDKKFGLKSLIKDASKDYCAAIGKDGGSFAPFENTALFFENTAVKSLEAFEKDLL